MTHATPVETDLRQRLQEALAPVHLEVVNESHLHAGHRSSPGTGDSHFRVRVVSAQFVGLGRVARQRLVNVALAPLIGKPIHALGIEALSPEEHAAAR